MEVAPVQPAPAHTQPQTPVAPRFKGADRILYDAIADTALQVIDDICLRAQLGSPVPVPAWGLVLPTGCTIKIMFCSGYWITIPGHGNIQYRSQVALRQALENGPPQQTQGHNSPHDAVIVDAPAPVGVRRARAQAGSVEVPSDFESSSEDDEEDDNELVEELLEERKLLNKRVLELETELDKCKRRLVEVQRPEMPADELQRRFNMFAHEVATRFLPMSQDGNATCRICMTNKVDRVITCGHAYCASCLDKHIRTAVQSSDGPPTCPHCRGGGDLRKAKRVLNLFL